MMPDPIFPAIPGAPVLSTGTSDVLPSAHPAVVPAKLRPNRQNFPPDIGTMSARAPPTAAMTAQMGHAEISGDNRENSIPSLPKLMTTGEVAAFFGCTERTIRNWCKRGILHARRVGGSVFFREDEVLALLNEEAHEEQGDANG